METKRSGNRYEVQKWVAAELERIARDENRSVTDEDRARVKEMFHDLDNEFQTVELVETKELKAAMDARYEQIGGEMSATELIQIARAYQGKLRHRNNAFKYQEPQKLSIREREIRAAWWIYETYGISQRHGRKLSSSIDALETISFWSEDEPKKG